MTSSSKKTNAVHFTEIQDQEVTREQLSDVYAAGTSDGIVQLAEGTVQIANDGYQQDEPDQQG